MKLKEVLIMSENTKEAKKFVYSEKAREAQREYHRQWRKKNPDKVRAKNIRFWEKKASEMMEKHTDDHS